MEGLDDVFGEPNGPEYENRQVRTRPPLEYVSEKFGASLRALHRTIRSIQRFAPADLSPAAGARTPAFESRIRSFSVRRTTRSITRSPPFWRSVTCWRWRMTTR